MSIVHIAVDMSEFERDRFRLKRNWKILSSVICDLKQVFHECHALTIHTSYTKGRIRPMVGSLKEVEAKFAKSMRLGLLRTPGFRFRLPVKKNDWVATKNTPSACTSALVAFLRERNIDTVVLTGVWEGYPKEGSNHCVTATAIDFVRNNFRVIIASEGTNVLTNNECLNPEDRIAENKKFGIEVLPIRDIVALLRGRCASGKAHS